MYKLDNLPPISPLEVDEEKVKKGDDEVKVLKILTPNKLLTRLLILLAQIKAGINSYDLKNELRQIPYLYNIGSAHLWQQAYNNRT